MPVNGPVVISLDADTLLRGYSTGILMFDLCQNDSINHAVVLVGYGTENGVNFWRLRNSWGTWWGERGYFRVQRNGGTVGTCGMVKQSAFYITG